MKIGLVQMECTLGDVKANLSKTLQSIAQAEEQGVDLLVFPELSLTGYSLGEKVPQAALRLDDEMIEVLRERSQDVSIVVGLVEETPDYSFHNSALYLEGGEIRHVHRKLHLPTYGLFQEVKHFAPGEAIRAFDTGWGRMAILICADCWSPPLAYIAAMDGALLLIHIAASPVGGLGKSLDTACTWENINRLYAQLYTCYVVFVNRVGSEGELRFWGGSEIVDPIGKVVVKADRFEEVLVTGEIDLARVREQRVAYPALRQERPDLIARELERVLGKGRA